MKKLIGFGLLLIMGVCMFSGCSSVPEGSFYTLQEAYDNGWLTQEDLMSIAYFYNNGREANEHIMPEDYKPSVDNIDSLDGSTEKGIKQTFWYCYTEDYLRGYSLDDVYYKCYGRNRKCIAITIGFGTDKPTDSEWFSDTVVGNVTFRRRGRILRIWKEDIPDSLLDENGNGLADGFESELKKAYYHSKLNIDSETQQKSEPLGNIEIGGYFGIFNGAYVIYRSGNTVAAMVLEETVDGITFVCPMIPYIFVYHRNKIYSMQEAVDKGILTHEDIVTIHKEYERQS